MMLLYLHIEVLYGYLIVIIFLFLLLILLVLFSYMVFRKPETKESETVFVKERDKLVLPD